LFLLLLLHLSPVDDVDRTVISFAVVKFFAVSGPTHSEVDEVISALQLAEKLSCFYFQKAVNHPH
jgi:hypothetical protein